MTASSRSLFRKIGLLVVPVLLAMAVDCAAQQTVRVSGEITDGNFDQLVTLIEAQTEYHFHYNPAWTDSLVINIRFAGEPVSTVLSQVLSGTHLHVAIYKELIYITRERQLLTGLPPDYFNQEGVSREAEAFDYSAFERLEKEKKAAEERLYTIGARTANLQGNATLAGTIRDMKDGEPVVGASVYIEEPLIGTMTDQFGYYSITLPKGRQTLKLKSIGMKNTLRQVILYANGRLDIEMEPDITPLKEVLVESDRDARVTSLQMGMEKLDIKTMKNMPLALGETDILKVVLTLPGVQTVGEGTVGLNIRGGATNQNLILYNNAVVYNPSHLFGFFSTFNPDVLKNVELYKSGVTADYGGRLSAILDVHAREGNLKKISGSGGISPITGRFTLEGPLIKDKTSFLFGARSTYSNWILRKLDDEELQNSDASFYDLNASITHQIDDDNNLYLSAYASRDKFRLDSDTLYTYGDQNASLTWKHVFNSKLYGTFTGTVSKYQYELSWDTNPVEAFALDFSISQWNTKADLSYSLNVKHTLTGGASVTGYHIQPGQLNPVGSESKTVTDQVQKEQGIESAFYLGDNFDITPNLSMYAGMRYSFYQSMGPRDVFEYMDGVPRSPATITDTVHHSSGPIAKYGGIEPRFSLRYSLSNTASVKFSFNRMRQYVQMISNTTAITPTDIWKLSDAYIKPQVGDQYSLGFYKNLRSHTIETSVEAYYKTMKNTIDFRNGADLVLSHHLETEVVDAEGKAYGIEFLVKKSTGKLNGWVSYTWSRSFLRETGTLSPETINGGAYYASSYDKPHSVNFIGNYKFSRRFNFSLNVIYSTGRPITVPIAKYQTDGSWRVLYGDRNAHRIPDYFRTDISINIEGNHKIKKLAHSSWTFAIYNLTGRENAYSVYFVSEADRIKGYKLSVFARPIPTITYNFKF